MVRLWGCLDHLGPYWGAESVALVGGVIGVSRLFSEIEEGTVATDDIVGEPLCRVEAV